MGYQGKSRRNRLAAGLAAVLAAASTVAAHALDTGSVLAPLLASAPVAPFGAPAGGYAAFATGTVLHAGVVGSVAGLDFVSSTAAATAAASTSPVNSELGQVALPALPAKGSYGQGVGLGLGVGLLPGLSAGLFGNARAVAPPSTAPVQQDAAPISLPPLVSLTPFRGQAQALSSAAGCVLGSNLAFGRAEAADLTVAGQTALSVGAPAGSSAAGQPVADSESSTAVVTGSDPGRLGLLSETTQTLAPVTFLAGTANQFTVNLLGRWALRVTADGRTGSVSYGPQVSATDQSVLEVRNAAGAVIAGATAAQLLAAGDFGLHISVSGVGEIVVGEQPRARGRTTPAEASGTNANAAADIVRVRLLGQDIRLGHMEAAVAVPPAGVTCPGLQVSVTPAAATVAPGDTVSATVKVSNPNEGTANDVAIGTRFTADPGIDARPGPVSINGKQFDSGLVGLRLTTPLGPGQAVDIPMAVRIVGASRPGRIHLGATASGHYGDGPLAVPAAGAVDVDGPTVSAAPAAPNAPNSAGTPAPVRAGAAAPAGSGGRRPARASAGTTGAAGPAASAAPVTPAPTGSAPSPAPAVEPTPAPQPPASEPAPAPAPAPPAPPAAEHTAAPKARAKGTSTDRRRWAWGAAAAVFLTAIAAAGVARLTAGARRP
jgi:hypothetical protein